MTRMIDDDAAEEPVSDAVGQPRPRNGRRDVDAYVPPRVFRRLRANWLRWRKPRARR